MSTYELPRALWTEHPDDGLGRVVESRCPFCQRAQTLWSKNRGHGIDRAGRVIPSVACAYACGFHEHVELEGWAGSRPRIPPER